MEECHNVIFLLLNLAEKKCPVSLFANRSMEKKCWWASVYFLLFITNRYSSKIYPIVTFSARHNNNTNITLKKKKRILEKKFSVRCCFEHFVMKSHW